MQLKVQIGAVGHRTTWLPVVSFAAAAFACRTFIEAHDLGASRWRGGQVVDSATNEVVATVSYNGRVWLADGSDGDMGQRIAPPGAAPSMVGAGAPPPWV